eukprot:4688583-Amphidinium_carterae.3
MGITSCKESVSRMSWLPIVVESPTGRRFALSPGSGQEEAAFSEKPLKKPKEADVEKLSNAVTRGFNRGGFSHLQQEMASGMVAGKRNSFDDAGLLLGDITELIVDDDFAKKDETNRGDASLGQSPKTDGDAGSPESKEGKDDDKKRKWFQPLVQREGLLTEILFLKSQEREGEFDADGAINSSRRSLREQTAKLTTSCTETLAALNSNLSEVFRCSPEEQRLMAGEVKVAETRKVFLAAVLDAEHGAATLKDLGTKAQVLHGAKSCGSALASLSAVGQELIQGYASGAPPSMPSQIGNDGSTTVVNSLKLGSRPPCQRYTELVILQKVGEVVNMLDGASTEEQIKEYMNVFNGRKGPIVDLELGKALKSAASHGSAAKKGKEKALPTVFEAAASCGVEVAEINEGCFPLTQDDLPLLIKLAEDKSKEFLADVGVKRVLDSFSKQVKTEYKTIELMRYQRGLLKVADGRTRSKIPSGQGGALHTLMRERLKSLLKGLQIVTDIDVDPKNTAIKLALEPTLTFATRNSCYFGPESALMTPAIRMSITAGVSREVILISHNALGRHIKDETGVTHEQAFAPMRMRDCSCKN